MYKKKTDKNQYLLLNSCHPKQTVKSIPFSVGLRIVRIGSAKEDKDKQLEELRIQLLAIEYDKNIVDKAVKKARAIRRDKALKEITN